MPHLCTVSTSPSHLSFPLGIAPRQSPLVTLLCSWASEPHPMMRTLPLGALLECLNCVDTLVHLCLPCWLRRALALPVSKPQQKAGGGGSSCHMA